MPELNNPDWRSEPKVWVVCGPDGLYWCGIVDGEDSAWRIAFGWPDEDDIKAYKAKGFYAAEATITWQKPHQRKQGLIR